MYSESGEGGRLLHRPIFGGVFGRGGRYALASMPCVSRGLHTVRYMVVEPHAGAVLSVSEDKVQALAGARRVLHATGEVQEHLDQRDRQLEIWPIEAANEPATVPLPALRVSRRRQEVFEKSEGRCHYCGTPLALDGPWHVEHMMPRALGGTDGQLNLVAACAPCNLRKGALTAIEYMARAPQS